MIKQNRNLNKTKKYRYFTNALNLKQKEYTGTLILINKDIDVENHQILIRNRVQQITIRILEKQITIINIYSPPSRENEKEQFYENLKENILTLNNHIILGGDFNNITSSIDSNQKDQYERTKSEKILKRMNKEYQLIDSFRYLNGNNREYTRTRQNISRKIDRIYISTSIKSFLDKANHIYNTFSDHYHSPHIILREEKSRQSKQKTNNENWKINNSILNLEEYKSEIRHLIEKERKDNFQNLKQWENLKKKIKKKNDKLLYRKSQKTH